MMPKTRTFVVVPLLPEELKGLRDIAYNMCWAWNHDAIELFQRLDRKLWTASGHNPVKMLGKLDQERMNAVCEDVGFRAHLERVEGQMQGYMESPRWYESLTGDGAGGTLAYFSAEFGLHESLPIYSGGLGILAGDHLKSASDLGLPLVAVGLLYRQGYFQQYLNADGWQQESYPDNDFYNMSVTLMKHEDERPIRFHIEVAGREVVVQIWRVQVGLVSLYLLDTNLRCNRIEDRQITGQLYGGDNEMRLRQEILLGIGGYKALMTLGIEPTVCHMNEGHAAFLALERIRCIMNDRGVSFQQAREATVGANVFTTHTPVPAGHDVFGPALMEKYFARYAQELDLSWQDFLALGRVDAVDLNAPFSMTVLALRSSMKRNGVSALHGEISRSMCQPVWKGVRSHEIPISSITNGVHVRSWVSHEMSDLFDRYLGPDWAMRLGQAAVFERVEDIPDEELWRTHERRRERLVSFARRRLRKQLERRGAGAAEVAAADEVLDPEALTIGFSRRFATYKRGTLLFRDIERFANIVGAKDRPMQIIFAGKAHPRDSAGKELIRTLVHTARAERFRGRVVFLENYDITVARYLVQGVDVWLNTPRRGMEASGTSGMKVLCNGGLNLSVLDGWWCEGYRPGAGWAIGCGESYEDKEYADDVESQTLYDLLEKEVIPMFYKRGKDRLPREWLQMMKQSMRELTPQFSTSRMVAEYAERFYIPSVERWRQFGNGGLERAVAVADWKESMRDRWDEVRVLKVDAVHQSDLPVGGELSVRCQVRLGTIDPSDVSVEIYYGLVDSEGQVDNGDVAKMEPIGSGSEGVHVFSGVIPCRRSGLCGFNVRVLPDNPDLADKFDTGLICREEAESEPEPAKEAAAKEE